MTELKNKTVLITGGGSGLGKRMALVIAGRGAKVVLCDINRAAIDAAVAEIQERTGQAAHGYACDISDRAAVYALAETIRADIGEVDVLINNAGVVSGKPILEIPDELIERTFAVNSLALFWMAKAFLPAMVARNAGHIVTIASASGLVGVRKLTDYAASKFAAVGFDESLRYELQETAPGIRTTVVCPYFINTGMFDGVSTRFPLLLPILEEPKVVARIVRAIERDELKLIMPPFVKVLPLTRLLPTRLFDALANFFGVNASMDEFRGRKPAPESKDEGGERPKRKLPIVA